MTRRNVLIAVIVVALAGGYWLYARSKGGDEPTYRFVTIERGDIRAAVSATGSLSAVTTIEIGTQVSGRITAIYADFNDEVDKGQLIARVDPILQQQAVRDGEAGVERARAEAEQAEQEYRRNLSLFEQKVLTEIEFNTAKYARAVALANLKSAEVSLDRARQNLAYTAIYAPIDGIVVERTVSVGQTVAASFSSPKLFTIAGDLEQMQILASVDESDIGAIEEGQSVSFTVQAYPDDTFAGRVQKVRLQSTTTENVVNYTVVVGVSNAAGKLLPGMTASVDFLTGEARNVLRVPNAALRFRPTEQMIAEVRANAGEREGTASRERADPSDGASGAREGAGRREGAGPRSGIMGAAATTREAPVVGNPAPTGSSPAPAAGPRRMSIGGTPEGTAIFHLDAAGKLQRLRVRSGLSDGQYTEISGEGLTEGMQVIAGVSQASGDVMGSPFAPPARPSGPTRMPGGF